MATDNSQLTFKIDKAKAIAAATCPITGQIMRQPYRFDDGHVYELEAIKLWVEQFGSKSPVSKKKVKSPDIHDDILMRRLIESIFDTLTSLKSTDLKRWVEACSNNQKRHTTDAALDNTAFAKDVPKSQSIESKCIVSMTCPLGGQIMRDPCMATDGRVYDKKSLETLFNKGEYNSPVSHKYLKRSRCFNTHEPLRAMIVACFEVLPVINDSTTLQETVSVKIYNAYPGRVKRKIGFFGSWWGKTDPRPKEKQADHKEDHSSASKYQAPYMAFQDEEGELQLQDAPELN